MNVVSILMLLAGLAGATLIAWLPWRNRLDSSLGKIAFTARLAAALAVLLLVFDPGVWTRLNRGNMLVLLDNSVSMQAAAGQSDSALSLAGSLGEVVPFGELFAGEPGGKSELSATLATAVAEGRPITVITDGELDDVATVPADLLAQATVVTLPRRDQPDVAITQVSTPRRLSAGDTLRVDVDVAANGGWTEEVVIEVRDGNVTLMSDTVRFANNQQSGRLKMSAPLPPGLAGERWLQITVAGTSDAEPDNHTRLRRLNVTPSPGIVVIAEHPDWDARFLYDVLESVTESPVRGFIQITPGIWRTMGDLTPVAEPVVIAAARQADLLAVRGDTSAWNRLGAARLLWPDGGVEGDWYLAPAAASPLTGSLVGTVADSLPPALALAAVDGSFDWVAMAAQRARRGESVPALAGSSDGGRSVVIGAQGLYRWALRGGASEQLWRTMLAEAATWLLDAPARDGAPALPVRAVTQRGNSVLFKSSEADATPMPIALSTDSTERLDTLRFDNEGIARLPLPVGRYQFTFDNGAGGSFAVERYSAELVPAPVTLNSASAQVVPQPPRRSLRELLFLFGVAVGGLGLEWILRRRLGLR